MINVVDLLIDLWFDHHTLSEWHLQLFLTECIKHNNGRPSTRLTNKLTSITNARVTINTLLPNINQILVSTTSPVDLYQDDNLRKKACARIILGRLANDPPFKGDVTKQSELLTELLRSESNFNLYLWMMYLSTSSTDHMASLNKLLIDVLRKDNKVRAQFNLSCDISLLLALISIDRHFFDFHVQTLFTIADHYIFKFQSPNEERAAMLLQKLRALRSLSRNNDIQRTLEQKINAIVTKSTSGAGVKVINRSIFEAIQSIIR
ncbi:hypothetical protein SAMD00019534_074070 [Acytostelium subglobosum LB1]|uniref:hypothetical protein n=1 Tax=Acytostelium subglobosum LB1 TaxID=1410327 RepID=UPI0006449070|nr:hypothetical protein SAMD00019534_074070 [Acytostelium subglobosum LB1]GAM24232.1 hypothetical protein SAMD00019534_074070 [Acytostelium subglobosum LB1]|eukprot:XP_012752558.1 hypothetical protein SAMD00019534_074070 [Acytostelium subglobosum LB1]